jgi:hypothetical protein
MITDRPAAHDALLVLAGKASDDDLAVLRTCLADEEDDEFAGLLAAVVGRLSWSASDADALRAAFTLDDLRVGTPPEREWRFTPGASDEADHIALHAARSVGGLRALWRADRDGRDAVYLGEAARGGDVIELAAEMQHELAEGGHVPRVEVFTEYTRLPGYHEAAFDAARLVWQDQTPSVRLARVFDGVDPTRGPYFRPEHPRLSRDEGSRVAEYLGDAQVVLHGPGPADDVMMPHLKGVVPVDFRSDGSWVWPDAVRYYLQTYGLSPEPELVRRVLTVGSPAPLSRLTAHHAREVLADAAEEGTR